MATPDPSVWPRAAQGVCRGPDCQRPILWCHTDAGKRQPVDPIPQPDGILILTVDGSRVRSRVETLFDTTNDAGRYRPHHQTCANVNQWRALQATNPGAEF